MNEFVFFSQVSTDTADYPCGIKRVLERLLKVEWKIDG